MWKKIAIKDKFNFIKGGYNDNIYKKIVIIVMLIIFLNLIEFLWTSPVYKSYGEDMLRIRLIQVVMFLGGLTAICFGF